MIGRRHVLAAAGALAPEWGASAASSASAAPWRRLGIAATGLSSPVGMAIDRHGRLLVANWSAGTVTAHRAGAAPMVLASGLPGPSGLALSPAGELFVASYSQSVVWRILEGGTKEEFVRGLATPAGLSFDQQGQLLIANRATNQVLVADAGGRVKVAVEGGLQTPVGAVQFADGSYAVSNIDGGIAFAGADGRARTVSRELSRPGPGLALADERSVYVVDYGGTAVLQVDREGRTRVVAEGFSSPVGLVLTADKRRAIVADWGTNTAYEMGLAGG
ncbi:hypothetical protein AACH06_27960 [Ideonella sp. DXS29W]|uniref:Serine/threonine protein kinase n=1 Tax=Ideonella lacteola TaxID=2984193 RepID=A0ABU9C1F5_9BURK